MGNDYIYHTNYICVMSFLVLLVIIFGRIREVEYDIRSNIKAKWNSGVILVTLFAFIYIGFRPIIDETGDTETYAGIFDNIHYFDYKTDIIFYGLMNLLHSLGYSVYSFFAIVAGIYVCCYAYFCKTYFKENQYITFLSVLVSFSFLGYGINGIRNGLALALFLVIFVLVQQKKYWLALLLIIISINIHSSVLLPICAMLLSSNFKKVQWFYRIWIINLFISIFSGEQINQFTNLYVAVGAHDETYYSTVSDDREFSMAGFRYDFLLYGIVPIVISYYYIIVQKVTDVLYTRLSGIYVICNAFWLLTASSWLSNRFAFLSWFLYVFVAFYPILHFETGNKRKVRGWMLFIGNYAFTLCMFFLGKYK